MSTGKRIKKFQRAAQIWGFTIPWQLSSWKQFFLNEESFIQAAEKWLLQKYSGSPFPKIEDDVDRGLMKKKNLPIYPSQAQNWTGKTKIYYEPKRPTEVPPTEASEVLEHCI